jgi:hypothetical protein
LSMPNGVISLASVFLASYLAAKWQSCRTFVVMLATLVPLLGTALVYALPRSSTRGQMLSLYLTYCYWGRSIHKNTPLVPLLTVSSTICYRHLTATGQHPGQHQEGGHIRYSSFGIWSR